ncbi:short-chain dehydrogenase/reductase 2b-like [Nymphaea colorata]|nr:short-chain dehydrogenase/reductase 2b-like [Nymphaea colorata]
MEAKGSEWWSGETVAVVTGANRGIGLEICRQLADKGLIVIMTARKPQEELSSSAKQFLQEAAEMGRKNVIFHTLDIGQEQSVLDFVDWLKLHVGNIDILVNNAGIQTADVDWGFLKQNNIDVRTFLGTPNCGSGTSESHELAKECINNNYYGTKMLTNAILPLLRPSPYKARIVMVSSVAGMLYYLRDEELRKQLSEVEDLTEQKIDGVLNLFLEDLKSEKGMEKWPLKLPAYSTSKAALNAYTRLSASKLKAIACVNSVHPGFVRTDITESTGYLSAPEGAENVVRVALFPVGGPSGHNFLEGEDSEF